MVRCNNSKTAYSNPVIGDPVMVRSTKEKGKLTELDAATGQAVVELKDGTSKSVVVADLSKVTAASQNYDYILAAAWQRLTRQHLPWTEIEQTLLRGYPELDEDTLNQIKADLETRIGEFQRLIKADASASSVAKVAGAVSDKRLLFPVLIEGKSRDLIISDFSVQKEAEGAARVSISNSNLTWADTGVVPTAAEFEGQLKNLIPDMEDMLVELNTTLF